MNGFQKIIKIFAIALGIFIIINICGAIVLGISFLTYMGSNNSEEKTTEVTESLIENYQDINKIEIEIVSSKLIIKKGNEFKVETDNVNNNFYTKSKNSILKIEENEKWFWNNNSTGTIIVYIPESMNLQELDIDSGAGKIEIDGISAEKFNIDQGAGSLEIVNSSFNKAEIDGGAGEINISSSLLNNLSLDADVGKVNIDGEVIGYSNIECGIGEITISITGNEDDYKIIAKKGIGNLKIKGEEKESTTTVGNGKNVIKVEGGIGNININFN